MLGSDDSRAQFRTPLATAHKFNGFADAFLDNGGAVGLEDLYVTVAPKLPLELKGKFVYHYFHSNDGSIDYGDEYDVVISRKFVEHITLLGKFAYYDGDRRIRPDLYRLTLDASLSF